MDFLESGSDRFAISANNIGKTECGLVAGWNINGCSGSADQAGTTCLYRYRWRCGTVRHAGTLRQLADKLPVLIGLCARERRVIFRKTG